MSDGIADTPIADPASDVSKLYFFGLCQAQWAVLEREATKIIGFLLITIGAISPEQVGVVSQGLQMIFGGLLILRPIVFQIYKNSISQRIKEVSQLPNVKGVITDAKTANQTLASDLKVVANPEQLPKPVGG
jgi:hypothetical protein